MNVQKLKSLYIEMLKFEAKKTFCVEKRKVLFAYTAWMSLNLFWFSFEIDVGFVGIHRMKQPWFVGLPLMEG